MNIKVPYEEVELIAQLKLRDQSAFNALYDKYAPALYTVVLQMIHNKELVNKIIHKGFMIIWHSVEDYDPAKAKLFTWMLQIMRITAINETRSLINREDLEQDSESRMDGVSNSAKMAIDNGGLKPIVNKLGHEQKYLVNLYYYKGLSIEEIAEKAAIPESVVKTKMKTALSELGGLITNI